MLDPKYVEKNNTCFPRVVGYLISPIVLQAVLTKGYKIKGVPEDANIVNVQMWKPEESVNMLNVWFAHDSFVEVPWGNIIELRWADIDLEYSIPGAEVRIESPKE